MKVLAAAIISNFISTIGFGQSQIDNLKKIVAVQQAQITELMKNNASSSFAIGSIQQTFLTEKQFTKQIGSNWVLCDGRSVSGSKYEKLGYGSSVKDCRGRFLRTAGGNAAALGANQESALKKHKHEQSPHHHDFWSGKSITASGTKPVLSVQLAEGVEGRKIDQFPAQPANNYGLGVQASTPEIKAEGDMDESRPINVTVNTFIRIN